MDETQLCNVVKALAHEQGWIVFSLPRNRTVRPVKDAVGYPDLTCARDGEVLFIELKAQDGDMSLDQIVWSLALPAFHVIRPSDWYGGRVAELLA